MDLILFGNRIIDSDMKDILYEVKKECKNRYLKDVIDRNSFISITCPFHKDGCESHPSCSVYNRTDNDKIVYGSFHCFTCGAKGSLYKLVSKCLDKSFEDSKYWLVENFSNVYSDRKIYLESFENIVENKKYLDESILEKYSYFHPYQFQRGLTEEVIRKFKIGYDIENDMITFPIWDASNNLVGITKRSTKTKRFDIPKDFDKPVYLLNFIKKENITTVIVCESQINTLTCWSWGFPAIGLIGTGSYNQYEILKHSGIRNYILAFDGDLAGDHGALRFIENMPKDINISKLQIPQGKDVNDLSKQEFLNLLKNI